MCRLCNPWNCTKCGEYDRGDIECLTCKLNFCHQHINDSRQCGNCGFDEEFDQDMEKIIGKFASPEEEEGDFFKIENMARIRKHISELKNLFIIQNKESPTLEEITSVIYQGCLSTILINDLISIILLYSA